LLCLFFAFTLGARTNVQAAEAFTITDYQVVADVNDDNTVRITKRLQRTSRLKSTASS
jgi:hypothetical protein